MSTKKDKTVREVMKTKPTIFPLGFSISRVERTLIVVDFIDELNGRPTIIESIAMPMDKASQLAAALTDVINDNDDKSEA